MEIFAQITGRTLDHLTYLKGHDFLINKNIQDDFLSLIELCKNNGFDLSIHSSFRNYNTQLKIWNEKAIGNRDLLDELGNKLDFNLLSKDEVLFSILRWSALPGMSRHHWGTDIDVYDKHCLPSKDYKVELTPQEVAPTGCFGELHLFLDEVISSNKSFNFFRPYSKDLGGVSPEKWHLSHIHESSKYFSEVTFEMFTEYLDSLNENDIQLLNLIKKNKEVIYERYITNISQPNW